MGVLGAFALAACASEPAKMDAAGKAAAQKRVVAMKALGGAMGAHGKVAKGEAAYSPDLVTKAEELVSVSTVILTLFPEGSGGPPTRAKPEIWKEWAKFEKGAKAFQAAAPQLLDASKSGDKAKIGAALARRRRQDLRRLP